MGNKVHTHTYTYIKEVLGSYFSHSKRVIHTFIHITLSLSARRQFLSFFSRHLESNVTRKIWGIKKWVSLSFLLLRVEILFYVHSPMLRESRNKKVYVYVCITAVASKKGGMSEENITTCKLARRTFRCWKWEKRRKESELWTFYFLSISLSFFIPFISLSLSLSLTAYKNMLLLLLLFKCHQCHCFISFHSLSFYFLLFLFHLQIERHKEKEENESGSNYFSCSKLNQWTSCE